VVRVEEGSYSAILILGEKCHLWRCYKWIDHVIKDWNLV